jgi:serine/threonine protein kinase
VKLGQTVNGYEIVTRPSNANAGKCLWAFARKNGEEFFIKEFLDPKRPRPDSMGSVADKERRLAECERFAQRQRQVSQLLRADHPRAGNLVLAKDFFVDGTRYYKVTGRIDGTEVRPHELDPVRQVVLLRTLAESLGLLHECGIVHGDLKPENVLLHQPDGSDLYTAKLIDFDDAYPVGEPPPRDIVAGNPLYGAPEWLRYVRGDRAVRAEHLTQAVDVFAFGLLLHTYLCGALPDYGTANDSPAAAVLAGQRPRLDPGLDGRLAGVLLALTDADPACRPSITEAVEEVVAVLAGGTVSTTPEPVPGRSRVRVNLTGRVPEPPRQSRLRINMPGADRREERAR